MDLGRAPARLILAPLDQGVRNVGGRPGTAKGPARVHQALQDEGLVGPDGEMEALELANEPASLEADLWTISDAVTRALVDGRSPVVLGGDHGITYATVLGAHRALGRVCVTYLDVHLDMRPYWPVHTSGSSFRRLIDEGLVAPTDIHPLGIQRPGTPEAIDRSGFDRLAAYADAMGVGWVELEQAKRAGLAKLVADRVSGPVPACLSLDVDCLDEQWAAGVSAPGSGRFSLDEVRGALTAGAPHARVLDVVEYAPGLDQDDRTLGAVVRLLEAFLEAAGGPG